MDSSGLPAQAGTFLYCVATGLTVGVVAALILHVQIGFLLACLVAVMVLVVWGIYTHNKKIFLVALVLVACVLGVLRTESFLQTEVSQSVLPYSTVGKDTAVVEGKVTNDPEHRATSVHAIISVSKINGSPVSGSLLAILALNEQVQYGDTVILQGSIAKPQPFVTNTGHLFDYEGYLEVQGVSALMPNSVLLNETPSGFSLQKFLFETKHMFERSVENLFPEPDGSLLEGILLGERRSIPQSLTQAFIASSLVHIVVLSGHNITIVSEGVFRALAFLPRIAGYGVGAVLMVLFALMTGAGATTVRALIMALVALLARYQHRSALALRSLALAISGMVLWNPPSILHDSSFILSILATFGLITLAPWVEQKIWRVPNYKRFDVRSIIATTIAVEIFVTPALLYFNGTLSFFALPANILALPVVPLSMLGGFVAGLLGLLSPSLALIPTLVCDGALKWLILVATTIQSLPYSTATIAEFPTWILVAVYVPLTFFSILKYRSASRRRSN